MNFTLKKKERPQEEKKATVVAPEPSVAQPSVEPSKVKKDSANKKKKKSHRSTGGTGSHNSNISKKSDANNNNILFYFLPFGIGQFYQGQYGWGTVFATGQGAALAGYVLLSSQADKRATDANDLISQRDQEMNTLPENKQDAYYQETLNLYDAENKKIETTRAQATYSLGLFLALWIGSTVDAFLHEGSSNSMADAPSGKTTQFITHNGPTFSLQGDSKRLYVKLWDRDIYSDQKHTSSSQMDWSISPFISKMDHSNDGLAFTLRLSF